MRLSSAFTGEAGCKINGIFLCAFFIRRMDFSMSSLSVSDVTTALTKTFFFEAIYRNSRCSFQNSVPPVDDGSLKSIETISTRSITEASSSGSVPFVSR